MSTATQDFILSRELDAPRERVWKAFTDPNEMKEWWGPKGFSVIASKMDFRVGGIYHYGLKSPDGTAMWGKFFYREIDPQQKIVLVSSFSDEKGGVTRHPLAPSWPLEMLSTFSFDELPGGKTKFTLQWSPLNATAEEHEIFNSAHLGMEAGWNGTLDQLESYLVKR